MTGLVRDVRQAARLLARRPGVSALVALTLALGIAATTIAFSVADAVLWHPLPFKDASRLVRVSASAPEGSATRVLETWPAGAQLFDGLYPFILDSAIVTGGPEAQAVTIGMLTPGLVEALGIRPAAGRTFTRDDVAPDPDAVIVSADLWRRLQPDGTSAATAIGRIILVEGVPRTIVGVMPGGFDFPVGRVSLWRPYVPDPNARRVVALGRLRPGAAMPPARPGDPIQITPFVRKDPTTSRALQMVFGAAALLLLIAVANTANVLLADAIRRDAELAVRAALGASWPQLARQVAMEGLALSAVAVAAALLFSTWALGVLVERIPYLLFFQALRPIALDWRALTFAGAVATLAGLGASVLTIARARRLDAQTALRGRTSALPTQTRSRHVLTASQIAVTLALLACAGLVTASLRQLAVADPGFDPGRLVHVVVQIPTWRYQTDATTQDALVRAREAALGLPGVENATVAHAMPPGLGEIAADALEVAPGAKIPSGGSVATAQIDDAFFATLGIATVAGRAFDGRDRVDSDPAAIVSRSLAAMVAPGGVALGRRIRESNDVPWRTIVGVVEDISNTGMASTPTRLAYYVPRSQTPAWWFEGLIVRTRGAPESVVPAVRDVFHRLMPDAPIFDVTTGPEAMANTNARVAFAASLMTTCAGVALVVALVGVYASFWYTVRQRTREIGIRLALGAAPSDIRRMVVGRGLRLTLAGLAAGLPLALVAMRSVRSLVVDTAASEPATVGAMAVGLAAAAIAATYLPARRAARIDPVTALRQE
jgi:putative ABC transport system permease protein